MEKKRESQKMAAFNLGVAEAVNTKKHSRDPFHVSGGGEGRGRGGGGGGGGGGEGEGESEDGRFQPRRG